MSWKVTSQDLNQYAEFNSRRAEELAPLLIGKLIKASIDPTKFRFPNGNDIRLPGFDGELDSDISTASYIPKGASVWEISKSKDPDDKAKKDYAKRSPNSDITYVQCSFVPWPGAQKWRKENEGSGWKQVRTVDGVDIATWLEECPAVHRWLATLLGKRIQGCRDVEEAWRFWQSGTKVKIQEVLLIRGRENQVENFQQVLLSNSYVQVVGESRFESLGFILNVVKSSDLLSSSFLQIEDQQVFLEMATTKNSMTFLVDATTQHIGYAIDYGHTVIVISDHPIVGVEVVFNVDHVSNMNRAEGLVAMGFQEEKAYRIIEQCRNNLDIMRYLPIFEPIKGPDYEWLKIEGVYEVLFAAFIMGSWGWDFELDCKIFTDITHMDLDRCKTLVQVLSQQTSSPIQIEYNAIAVLSRPFLWNTVVRGKLHKADISKTIKIVFNLDNESSGRKQSHRLKTSVVKLLNYFSSAIEAGHGTPISQGDINYFVRRILEQENQYELSSFFNTLAEAAPETFLKHVDRWVSQNALHPALLKEQAEHNVFNALELLAWNRKYLAASSRILIQLAASQESAISRRALSSFRRIFKIRSPKTSATLEERLQLIGVLIEKNPLVGWNLLMKLIPSSPTDNSYLSHKPSEKEWHLNRSAITRAEVMKTLNKLVDLALVLVNSEPGQSMAGVDYPITLWHRT